MLTAVEESLDWLGEHGLAEPVRRAAGPR